MCYMMSEEACFTDDDGHNMAHLMFYTSLMGGGALWGCGSAQFSGHVNPQFHGAPEPIDVFMVPPCRWSDGTAAPVM